MGMPDVRRSARLAAILAVLLGVVACAPPGAGSGAKKSAMAEWEQPAWDLALSHPEGWAQASEAFDVVNSTAFGSSEEAVAWDQSSITHTAGGAVLQHLVGGARMRILVMPVADNPDVLPEQVLKGTASQMRAFEKGVKAGEIEERAVAGTQAFALPWEGTRSGAEVAVRSLLVAVRHGEWDYQFQFDALPDEWKTYADTFDAILESVRFSESTG